MRRQPTEMRSQGTRIGSRDESRGALAKRSRLRRLTLEALEARQLLATNPMSVVTNQVAASASFAGTTTNDSSPSIAVDPIDPSKLVAVFTDRNTSSGTTLFIAQVTFSNDGGKTWSSSVAQPNLSGDPTSTTGARLQDTAEGVGFDRNGNFFVGVLETNNSNAGDVMVDKYSFSGSTPTPLVIGSWGNQSVYSWDQAVTGNNLQPAVVNFSMAVDDNVSAYVDPSTNAAQSDPNSGAVFLALTLNTPPPPTPPSPYNPFTIQAVASSDGVTWPGSGTPGVSSAAGITGPAQVHLGFGNVGNQRYTDPQITVSQGKAGGSDGGQVSVIWDDYASGNNDNPPDDYIFFSPLTYKLAGGAFTLGTTNPFGTRITTTTVRGNQTGSNFALSTPSSPNGIGPEAVITVDNTLGSYSANQGRLYIAYVNRSTATGNPVDNTDIDLIHSDNDGASWSAPTVVNDDLGAVDGHTGDDGIGTRGRPQYQPAIAVDNSTGTLVMSWLDVRDDSSLDRYADYLTTSTDGGSTFSPQTFADQPNIVTDATTGSTFVAGPYPGNESGGNPGAETSTAFGQHQGLAVANGVIHPAWATTGQNLRGDQRLTIETARATMPAGPRIISGTSGAIAGTSFQTFTVTFDRPVSIASFSNPNQVTVQYLNAVTGATTSSNPAAANFDPNLAIASIIPLDPQHNLSASSTIAVSGAGVGDSDTTVAVSGLTISYPSVTTPLTITLTSPGNQTVTLATNVGSLNNQTFTTNAFNGGRVNGNWTLKIIDQATGGVVGQLVNWSLTVNTTNHATLTDTIPTLPAPFTDFTEATQFRVNFLHPQTGVGTYSYSVSGAAIQDLLRGAGPTSIAFDGAGTAGQVPTQPSPGLPESITDAPASTSTTVSTIQVSGVANGIFVQSVVPDISINYPNDANLTVTLTSPAGVVVTLVAGGTATGANFNNTAFSDAAPQALTSGTAPYTGLFKPAQPLAAFANGVVDGTWTLTITDAGNAGLAGSLATWSLNITTQPNAQVTTGNPTPAPAVIRDAAPATSQTASTIGISFVPPADVAQTVTVSNLTINYPTTGSVPAGDNATPLTLELTAPGGQTAVIATNVGNLNNATLSTNAFTGGPVNGIWTLTIIDSNNDGLAGQLVNWSLHVNAGRLVSSTASPGNLMDQNPSIDTLAAGVVQRVGNFFANPAPLKPTANPFAAPYDTATLPIVIGGPRVVSSFVPGGTSDPTGSAQPGNNLVLNGTVGSIDVTFSSPMNPATFTGAQVLTMMGPIGPIGGPFTVVPDPQLGENPSFPNTFKISFPTQQLSGTYTLTLGAGIKSSTGIPIDTNQNAGVGLLFTNATGTIPAGPATFTGQSAAIASGTPLAPSTVSTSITVPANDNSLIQDFSLQLNIAYPNDPDLTAVLTTPIINPVTQQPFTVLLFSGDGSASGSTANFTNTVFNDGAATLIQNGAPPFFGQFKPLQSLLVNGHLLGASEAGTYTLTITNVGAGTGTLNGWSITTTPQTTTNTGLGEPVADQTTASFRIFTMDPTNPLSSNTWTPVGPASNNNGGNSGRVSGIVVDPSDPSGNTVYVSGASGGVWKTTDFLTTKSGGPTYVLLTGNAVGGALNIGSIAVFGRNNDPNQSIIVAGTGEGNTAEPGVQGGSTIGTSKGVGFLISYNGGKTWTLDDSLVNYDATGNELPESKRTHDFVGTTTFKVLIDPNPAPDGNVIMYAALGGGQVGSGNTAVGGVYRSLDSGHTWQLMRAGFATDIVFDPNSGAINAVNNPTGNLRTLYAAFQADGIYLSPNQGQTWNPMNGGVGDPLLQNIFQGVASPVPVGNAPLSPKSGGAGGRIVLAKPALTGNALLDAEYETWLYAAIVNPAGHFSGLFVTKDNGANWTDALLANALPAAGTAIQGADPTNDIGQPGYDITGGQGNYDLALAVDPNDPNITYIGGSADFGPTTMIRVDITRLADPYSVYASAETAGGQILKNTTSPVTIKDPTNLVLAGFDPLSDPFTNLYRNPNNIFANDSTVFVRDTGALSNDGSGAWWTPFAGFIGGTDVHTIVPIKDPLTGKTRLLVGYDQGVATGIDDDGTILTSIGSQPLASGVRNGNIQITQFYNGAAQPSALAAQVAGALFYGEAQDDGFPTSDPNVLTDGNIGWAGSTGDGTDVVTDATGSGTTYQSVWPCCNTVGPDEFFQVNGVGRTFGLLQSTSVPPGGGLPGTPDPQWPFGPSFNFTVNPVDNQEMIIGSGAGRLFETEDQGLIWTELAEPTIFENTPFTIPALAYGAPDPNGPGIKGALDNYMLIGNTSGHIFVTFTGGGNGSGNTNAWIPLSNGLDGSSVQRIITDPTRGTHDAYAVTTTGVFYNANTAAANSTWVNITGDLYSQTTTPFGDANLTNSALDPYDTNKTPNGQNANLGALAVDWRYVIPFDPKDPTKGTHPMIYIGGVGGVYRSTNNGTNWTAFPDQTLATPVPNGNLPSSSVTDLDMVLGNVDPTTGHPNVSTGPNLLLATTYGTGSYGIRLAPIVFNDSTNKVTEAQNSSGVLTFNGLSEQSAFGTSVAVTIMDVTDPNNPIFLGGYNTADGAPTTSPTFNTKANQTDVNGKFSVSGSYPQAPANNPFIFDGARTVEVFATDASGTRGNVVTFQITNNLPTPPAPIFINTNGTPPPLTNAVTSGGTVITTTATAPTFAVTLPGSGITAAVTLVRTDSQGNAITVNQANITGSGTIQDTSLPAGTTGTFTYTVFYTVTIDGNPTNSPSSVPTTVKVASPETIGLFPSDDSGTLGDGVTNVTKPRFVGTDVPNSTSDPNLKVQLVVSAAPAGSGLTVGQVLASGVDPSSGQYLLQPSTGLPDGTYGLIVRARDNAGDTISSSPLTLTISTAGPTKVPTLALVPASIIPPSTPPAGGPAVTIVRRPTVTGTTDAGATVTIKGSVNGGPLVLLATVTASQFKNGSVPAGTFTAQLPSNLNDGTITLFATASNAAGNTNPTAGKLILTITTAPGDYIGATGFPGQKGLLGAAGLAVYSPSTGDYVFAHAGTGITTFLNAFGLPNVDIPVPGDYNGDGQTDPAIYRPTNGYWAIDVNSQATGQAPTVLFVAPIFAPGPNVAPAPADFDVDGQTDPAIYTIVNGAAYFVILHNLVSGSAPETTQVVSWGITGDVPVPADFDGAGAAQVAVYRPSTGAWYVRSSGAAGGAATPAGKQETPIFVTPHLAGDVPVAADYDHIGRAEEAVFRPSNETFYIYNPNTKTTRTVTLPKLAGQGATDVIIPAPADYTGDGKADAAIFDQTLGTYEYINSTTGQVYTQAFFLTHTDIPPQSPYQFRAAADSAAPGFRLAGVVAPAPAVPPAPGGGSITKIGGSGGSGSASSAAVVIGTPVPAGSTSTGKASTLPTGTITKVPPIVLTTPSTGSARPAQDTTDSAIASLGKSYNGLFV